MRKKKILHIISSMDDGGAQRVVLDYLEHKSSLHKYSLAFLSLSPPTNSKYDIFIKHNNLPFTYLEYKRSNMRCFCMRKAINWTRRTIALYRFIQEHNIGALHTHITPIFVSIIFILIMFKGEKFHTMHSDPYRFSNLFVLLVKFVFHFLHVHPIAVSEGQREKAVKRYSLSECDVLRNSIDIAAIREFADGQNAAELRKKYNLPKNGFIIGSVGRLHSVKNYDGLIKIFAEYKKSATMPVYLSIAGDGKERGNLISLAQKLGVADSVFLVGNIEIDHVYEFYKMLDIFVMTSHTEAAPMSFLEAQAVGVRCVVASSVDPSMVYRKNVRCMEPNASISDWCFAFSDTSYVNKNVFPSEEFDLSTVMERLEKIYNKYL